MALLNFAQNLRPSLSGQKMSCKLFVDYHKTTTSVIQWYKRTDLEGLWNVSMDSEVVSRLEPQAIAQPLLIIGRFRSIATLIMFLEIRARLFHMWSLYYGQTLCKYYLRNTTLRALAEQTSCVNEVYPSIYPPTIARFRSIVKWIVFSQIWAGFSRQISSSAV